MADLAKQLDFWVGQLARETEIRLNTVPEMQHLQLPEHLILDNPSLAGAWEAITRALSQQLTASDDQTKQLHRSLKTERTRYLEHERLLMVVEGGGLSLRVPDKNTVVALKDQLQTLKAAQRLRLPSNQAITAAAGGTHNKPAPSDYNARIGGALDTVLGVESSDLRMRPAHELQLLAKEARPAVEQCLVSAAQHLTSAIAVNGLGGDDQAAAHRQRQQSKGGPSTILMQASASLVSHVAARVSAVGGRKAQLPADLAGLTAACLHYVQALSVMHRELASFVDVQMLKQQDQIDQVKVSHSVLMSEALAAKVQQLELQLMSLSYGAEDCQALAIVHAEIQNQAHNHKAVLEQLQCQLGAYHGLGPEFDALVGEYKRVTADLAHARFQEENFKALNQEMIDD